MNKTLLYKNATINYSVEGKGDVIVLLHGFLEDISMWNTLKQQLLPNNKVICIDLLGHGKSECIGYVHTMSMMATTVKNILDIENITEATFIGHSMGGYVALAFAKKHVKYLTGLCLLNSSSQADSEERKVIRLRAIEMAKTNYKALVSMSITNLFLKDIRKTIVPIINNCKEIALQTSVQGYIACAEGMRIRENTEEVLKTFKEKKLLITGKKDPVLVYDSIVKEAERTNTPLITLSNGHMSHIENVDELIVAIQSFLKEK